MVEGVRLQVFSVELLQVLLFFSPALRPGAELLLVDVLSSRLDSRLLSCSSLQGRTTEKHKLSPVLSTLFKKTVLKGSARTCRARSPFQKGPLRPGTFVTRWIHADRLKIKEEEEEEEEARIFIHSSLLLLM